MGSKGRMRERCDMRVLEIGPSIKRSKGGMVTVINGIINDLELLQKIQIDVHESYIDGNKIRGALYSVYRLLVFVVLRRGYDVYHIHVASYGSTFRKALYALIAKHWKKKVIFHIHGGEYLEFYRKLSVKNQHRLVNLLNRVDVVIALSNEWKRSFEEVLGIGNCVVLQNGIDTDRLEKAYCTLSNNKNCFLMLGRMCRDKGVYDLIDATILVKQRYPDVKVYIAGDGDVEKVQATVLEKGLQENIEILGWLDDEQKIQALRKVATVILPSYKEGLPMSILEGMAAGKVVIASRVGAIPEVIAAENGFLVNSGDIQGIAKAMLTVCGEECELEHISLNNRNKVRQSYSMKVMHAKLLQYIQK